jgi:general secretion pathway protein H
MHAAVAPASGHRVHRDSVVPAPCIARRPAIVRASLRSQRAFTLLEMLAVILLIGIAAAAVSISVTRGIASARINAAAGELAASLRATRTQAIVHSAQRTFELDISNDSYRGADQRDVRLPKVLQLSVTSATDDRIDGHTARIRFFPDGSSTGGRITLRSGQREWHVNVSWLTGAVNIFDSSMHP